MSTPTNPTGSHDLSDTYGHELEQTIGSLESGVTSITIDVGLRIIDAWYDALKNAGRDDLNDIANLLDELRGELRGDALDGGAIGDLLVRLGERTTAAAADADDDRLTPALERLGTVLTSAGEALGTRAPENQRADVGEDDLDAALSDDEADDLERGRSA